jgi:hypothetical protein
MTFIISDAAHDRAVTRGGLATNEAARVRSPAMSYDGLTFAELSDRFSSLRQAPLGCLVFYIAAAFIELATDQIDLLRR